MPNLDVSLRASQLSSNDASPVAAPAPAVAKIDAPDFGLAAPGAVLETIADNRVPVNPEISGISLAFLGGDLLNPDERDNTPPPPMPDIIQLSLKSSF